MTGPLPILATSNPVEHIVDRALYGQWYVSNVTVMLVLTAVLTALVVVPAARRIATGRSGTLDDYRAKGLLANLVETVCLYLRNDVFQPALGAQTDRFTPMLWTFFWFIFIGNALGLAPLLDITAVLGLNHGHGIGGTATQSIFVTGALAAVSFLFYNAAGLLKDPKGYFLHLTGGTPWPLWFLMVPVELIGMFVKPFALALRLFANMTGGHIIIAAFLGFIPLLIKGLGALGYGIAIVPILGAVAINLLEVLVALIQAFIFTFLTTVFLAQLVEEHGHGREEHGHGREEHGHVAPPPTTRRPTRPRRPRLISRPPGAATQIACMPRSG